MSQLFACARNVALCAAIVFSAANFSSAATVTLDTLLVPGATFTSGDKLFSAFTYISTPGKELPTAAQVTVTDIQDADDNFGIRMTGQWFDLPGNGASGFLVTFNVTATDPALLISDVHLGGNVSLTGPGLASVVETFLPLFPNVILEIVDEPGETDLVDSVIFSTPVRTLPVQKDITLFAMGNGPNRAHLSFIDQTFSQVPDPNQNEIAEPATISMVGLLSMFLGAIYMRRRLG